MSKDITNFVNDIARINVPTMSTHDRSTYTPKFHREHCDKTVAGD